MPTKDSNAKCDSNVIPNKQTNGVKKPKLFCGHSYVLVFIRLVNSNSFTFDWSDYIYFVYIKLHVAYQYILLHGY